MLKLTCERAQIADDRTFSNRAVGVRFRSGWRKIFRTRASPRFQFRDAEAAHYGEARRGVEKPAHHHCDMNR